MMRRTLRHRKQTAQQRKKRQAMEKERKLGDRREAYAEKKDAEFWAKYISLCCRYKRFLGGLSASTTLSTAKRVGDIEKELVGVLPYSYNCYRSRRL